MGLRASNLQEERKLPLIRTWNGNKPILQQNVYVNEMAYVSGRVELGERATVWPAAVIRAEGPDGSVIIDHDSHVQDGSVIHSEKPLHISHHVNIGHAVVIHAKLIGHHCLIGNNATLLEGVELGDYCLVASNAVVLEGTIVPSESFVVGVPAVIKPLLPSQRELLEIVAEGIFETVAGYEDSQPTG